MQDRFGFWLIAAVAVTSLAHPGAPVLTAQAPRSGQAGYAPPRTAGGQPDLQGVWRVWNLAKYDLEDHGAKPGVPAGRGFVVDPPDGKIPYLPSALEKRRHNYENSRNPDPWKNADPYVKCYLPGIPRMTYLGWPFQIVQDKDDVNMTYEWMHKKRIVPVKNVGPRPDPEGGAAACAPRPGEGAA